GLRAGGGTGVGGVARATAEPEGAGAVVGRMRPGPPPAGAVWAPPPWDAPAPDDVPAPPDSPMRQLTSMEVRAIDGMGFGADGQRRVWLRDHLDLVDGETVSPFQRLAMAADFASPLANSSSEGLRFINGDITVLEIGRGHV